MSRKTPAKPVPTSPELHRVARHAATKATESLREKIFVALMGFVLTGIIGTALTTWIQQRGWAWQNRVTKIDKDTENAMATYRSASELINARWHATYRLARGLERNLVGEEMKPIREAFDAADRDWALRYTNVAREVEFHIDTPFGVQSANDLGKVWNLTCADYALAPGESQSIDSRSARAVFEVINHCQGRTKDELEALLLKPEAATPDMRKSQIDLSFRRLDHLYRTNDVLRCVIFERALAIRKTISSESYWSTFFGIGQVNYELPPQDKRCG